MAAKIAGGVLLWLAAVAGVLAHTGVLLVDVDAADGPRLVVPVPLAMARAGLALAPDEVRRIRAPDLAGHLPGMRAMGEALRSAGDGILVEVSDGDERVLVTKEGDRLLIQVLEGGAAAGRPAGAGPAGAGARAVAADGGSVIAEVALPLASLESALDAYDVREGAFRTSRLVAALADAPRGDLVRVADGGDVVRVRRVF